MTTRATLLTIVGLLASSIATSQSTSTAVKADILRVFNKVILYEQGRLTFEDFHPDYETFREDSVSLAMKQSIVLLQSRVEPELIDTLLRLAVATQHSASEAYSFALGKMYCLQPGATELALKRHHKLHREFLLDRIDWGIVNLQHDVQFSRVADSLATRLQRFRQSVK
jgi:hypothetical protein